MTTYVHRCMIVREDMAMIARLVAGKFNDSSQDMFIMPLQPVAGSEQPTHYISVGPIEDVFAAMLVSPQALVDGAWALDVVISLEQAAALLNASDVSEDQAFVALERLGLKRWDEVTTV